MATGYRTPSPLRHVAFGIAGLISLMVVVGGAGIVLDRLSKSSESSDTLWTGVERVELDLGRGDVEIVQTRGKRTRVREDRRSGIITASSSRKLEDGKLRLDAGCHLIVLTCEVDYRIEVPAGTAIDVDGFAGSITVRDLENSSVRIESTAGDVRAIGVSGRRVEVESSAGTAEAERVTAPYVTVKTAAGNAIAELLAPPRDLIVETHAGDATATVPDVGYRVDANSDAGDTRVQIRRNDLSNRTLRVQTNAGNATVRALRRR